MLDRSLLKKAIYQSSRRGPVVPGRAVSPLARPTDQPAEVGGPEDLLPDGPGSPFPIAGSPQGPITPPRPENMPQAQAPPQPQQQQPQQQPQLKAPAGPNPPKPGGQLLQQPPQMQQPQPVMTPPSQAKLAAFVEQNPFVAGFLKCCFDRGLSPQQVAPLVKKASLLPEAREEFEKVAFWINGALTVASLLPWLWQWWSGNKQQQPEGQPQPGTKPGTQPKPPAPKSPNGIGVTEQPGATVAQSVSPNQSPIQPMAEPLEQPKLAYDKKSMAGLASLFRIPGLAGLLAKMFRSTPSTLAKGSPGAMEFGRAGILPGLRAKGPVQRMRSSMLPTNPPPVPAKTNLLPNLEKNAMWPWLARAGGWLANLFRWGKAGPKPGPTDPWAGFRSATPKAPPDRTWGKYMADVMAPSVIPAAGFIGLGIASDRAQQARMQAAQEAENQNIIQSAELADVASQNNPKAVEAFARKYGLGNVQQQALSNLYGNPFIQNALTGQGQAGAVLSGLKQFGSLPGMDGMKLTRNLANQLSPGSGHVLEFPTAGDSSGPNRP